MDYFIISIISLIGAALTLFSGFGLGTLLLPVFGIFFPIEVAVVLTAIVHFLNNLFKLIIFGRNANKEIVLKFGLPAIFFAFIGAYLLNLLSKSIFNFEFELFGIQCQITPLKIIIGILLIAFSLFDFIPKFKDMEFDKKYLSIGGVLSGFFGGISGHQGALRSAFLVRTGLTKEAFIATGVVIACLVDITRLSIYIPKIIKNQINLNFQLIAIATLSAFMGVYFGNKILQKTTISFLQNIVAILLFVFGILLILGVI